MDWQARLSKAQKEYLTVKAEWKKPRPWAEARWMTFPPPNVHRVLNREGLVDGVGQITGLGAAAREELGFTSGPPMNQGGE